MFKATLACALGVVGLLTAATDASAAPKNFYLVTTTQLQCSGNSSLLANVSATTLYEPPADFSNPYYLRLIGPGYNSLPAFNLTKETLHTKTYGPTSETEEVYRSAAPSAGGLLEFYPAKESGNLTLVDGYLLAVGGVVDGWAICEAEEADVIYWGATNSTCAQTYIQVVTTPPY